MAVLGGVLDELIDTHVVDTGDVAQITGATSRSVSRWATAKAMPRREAEDRLLELKAVVDQLRLVLRDEQARLWMRSPNPDLDWRKPLELIAEGEYRRVIAAVLAMAEGVTAYARGRRWPAAWRPRHSRRSSVKASGTLRRAMTR
jgi:putative toxin-antitoxin system antitoxin component (TIGR02293 family)